MIVFFEPLFWEWGIGERDETILVLAVNNFSLMRLPFAIPNEFLSLSLID